jgi:primosomal protein N' (replication factor Y)
LAATAAPGCRVRVPVGKRRLTGILLSLTAGAPRAKLRAVEALLDLEPVLTADLLDLGRFAADYYLAPIGEVFRAFLPVALPPWGGQRVWLTDAGALTVATEPRDAAILATLRERGRLPTSELQAVLGGSDLGARLAALRNSGLIAASEALRRGSRYQTAVELRPGGAEAARAIAGRSAAAAAIIDHLLDLGRPATLAELIAAVGCGAGPIRRLVRLGALAQFTQVERLDLKRHRLAARRAASPIVLRADQGRALTALTAAIEASRFAAFLLHGLTGAGKTEVYLRAAERTLAVGRSVVLLVPEISLVPALARDIGQRFGENVAILHSGLTAAERGQEWERIRHGEARLVVGPRSALFAPVPDLGLVVVDEEQDAAYKQDAVPRYHGRDLALVRAQRARAVALLVSATPSLESRHNAELGKLERLTLVERVGQGALPEGILVDLRQTPARFADAPFSERLIAELEATLAAGDQAMVLRNRRGYAPVLLCRSCGEDFRCPACALPRTLHRRPARLLCHFCDSALPVPSSCPSCRENALDPMGSGTERVEEEFRRLFPQVAVDVLDRDTVRRHGSVAAILERFGRGEVRVLIGTQMLSKGHHFPGVALTAVLSADSYLAFPDFRAVEKTYNLLTQIAGRAGRGDRPGKVLVQTYHPDHYAIRAALENDDARFAAEELRFRRTFHYPPFTRMILLLVRDRNRDRAETAIRDLASTIEGASTLPDLRLSGPAPAPFERLRGEWRFQLVLRSAHGRGLRDLVREGLAARPLGGLVVDVDPQHLL